MTKRSAKRISIDILDRWSRLRGIGRGRFIVDQAPTPMGSPRPTAYMFYNRDDAITFAKARFPGDYVVIALTDRGSVDITPA